jgi:hypothetical protein
MHIKSRNKFARLTCLVIFFVVLSATLYAQVVPISIDRVEPVTWRPSSDLVLRLSGHNLDGVISVATRYRGVRVIRTQSLDASHLLVWIRFSPQVEPGAMVLQVSTRFMTTFTTVPMFEPNATPSLALRGELTADK